MTQENEKPKIRPVRELRKDGLKIAEFDHGERQSYALQKSYKDKNGEWQNFSIWLNKSAQFGDELEKLQDLLTEFTAPDLTKKEEVQTKVVETEQKAEEPVMVPA